MRVLYRCNGNMPSCDKTNCIYNGGFCDCTTDVRYAKNFVKAERNNSEVLYCETTKNLTNKDIKENKKMDKMRKPPLGAPPRYIVDGIRSEELERAMLRCIAAGYPIRVEWVTEYNEIRERLGYKDDLHD